MVIFHSYVKLPEGLVLSRSGLKLPTSGLNFQLNIPHAFFAVFSHFSLAGVDAVYKHCLSGWWFGTFFFTFHDIWDNSSH